MSIFHTIRKMMSAHYSLLYLQTYEHQRVIDQLIDLSQKEFNFEGNKQYQVYKWDIVKGSQKYQPSTNTYKPVGEDNTHAETALVEIGQALGEASNQIFILEDFHEYMEQPAIKVRLRQLAETLKMSQGYKHIFILSPVLNLPKELEKQVTLINMPLPNEHDLKITLNGLIKDINHSMKASEKIHLPEELTGDLITAALGMTVMEAEQAFALAFIENAGLGEEAKAVISREKQQIIKKSGFLEYFDVAPDFYTTIGGLDTLKAWLKKRGTAFSTAAKNFGLKEPKGVLFTGVPGCGKSLTAKAISSMWRMPLLRFDIGKVFEAEVGSSEHNMRRALDIAEAVAPSILWIDELEKGLSGLKSSGQTDGGTTARVFGTLLTWMQEKNRPVFVVATSNDIDQLPPELLRKGRFDAIFYVDLPNREERQAIFGVHLKKALKTEQLEKGFDLELLSERSKGFNGAEIEEVVKEAMFSAFSTAKDEVPQLSMKHLIEGMKEVRKSLLAKVMREKIALDRTRARARFMMASQTEPESMEEIFEEPTGVEIRTGQEIKSMSRDWSSSKKGGE